MASLRMIEDRLATAARRNRPLTYSDVVREIQFRIPSIAGGNPYEIVTNDWTGLDRDLIGDFLGYASMRSYLAHDFMISAFAVDKTEMRPSEYFFELMLSLGALRKDSEPEQLRFWITQMEKAHAHHSADTGSDQ